MTQGRKPAVIRSIHTYLKISLFFVFSVISLLVFCHPGFSQEESADEDEESRTKIEGSFRLNFGIEDADFIWKDASYQLQEKTWRYLYGEKRYNTYDPAIYNQFKIKVESQLSDNFSVYTKAVIDPWSFTGKSRTVSIDSWYGSTNADDPVEIQLKYLSNNRRIYPETVRSEKGDSLSLPEIKVVDGFSRPATVFGNFGSGLHRIDIPEEEIEMEFKPMRALWLDYKEDEYKTTFFLFAEQDMGLYSDDPLGLINNHINWENSPWINMWTPGKNYTASGWENGFWKQDLFLKDSEGNWLTLLRGARFQADFPSAYADFMVAAPLGPWDDYGTINNIPLALRYKNYINDFFSIGGIYSGRAGYANSNYDALDQAVAIDGEMYINEYKTLKLEAALSNNAHHLSQERFGAHSDDFAYKAVFATAVDEDESGLWTNLSYAYMGQEFLPPLANYTYTRDDQSWGRHLAFYLRSESEENYRIGNGLDKDRKVIAYDATLIGSEDFDTRLVLRNVNRASDGKFLENVFRSETSFQATEKTLWKMMYLFHDRGRTDTGIKNDTRTYSGGLKYDLNESVSLEQIVECTNEYPSFPDGLYVWLPINPEPPYPYYLINKTRMIFSPSEKLEFALEYTYNEFDYAATLDDFMNYAGMDARYYFSENFSSRVVYRYSRVADYLSSGKVRGHHNVYCDLGYDFANQSSLRLQFSELGNYIEGLGWQNSVLDTQHIIRVVYEGRF